MSIVEFLRISKSFGAVKAVDTVSFAIRRGEFFSLLGPSGCGKTTTLRLLAGFEEPDPDGGEIHIAGASVLGRPPYQRRLGMVFQSYALFPHLSVERNVAYGLERHEVGRTQIPDRVARALRMVRLDPADFAGRRPTDLSGGQRQRVALARALVLEPEILLLDEPLGAIDLKLRKAMQLELKQLNRALGITFVYVTHDQDEALTMSDRIAVMDGGRVVQLGSPAEIYDHPRTAFVAEFIGESNLLSGTAEREDGSAWVVATPQGWRLRLPDRAPVTPGETVRFSVRPERIVLRAPEAAPDDSNRLVGTVDEVIYLGDRIRVLVALSEGFRLTALARNDGMPLSWTRGDRVAVCWLPEHCRLLEQR